MPGKKKHVAVGGPVGGLAALAFAPQHQNPLLTIAEAYGGWLAGEHAACWPDLCEPGTSSHHRDLLHGVTATTYGATAVFQRATQIQNQFRTTAEQCFQAAQMSTNGVEQILFASVGILCHVVAGAVPAIPAAYASHVVLDAGTPRSVPFLVRGF